MSSNLTYAASGVDIDAGNEAVRRIKRLVSSTRRPEQIDDIGGFAGMMRLPSGLKDPVLVGCTDGVGTKLLVAIAAGRHDTVGIDLVAMNVNDLVVTGAEPLFVLDYIATAKVVPEQIEAIVSGIVEGCRQSACSLLGGETAEMPGLYAEGHYDLAATAIGVVERERTLGPARVCAGDRVIALPSSGLHSNGYSLARRVLLEHLGLRLDDRLPGAGDLRLAAALLEPTKIYVSAMASLRQLEAMPIHAACHITGGGLVENPPRGVPENLVVELDLRGIPELPIMSAIAGAGVEREELRRTFNCGAGMLLYVDPDRCSEVMSTLEKHGQPAVYAGQIISRNNHSDPQVRFVDA